MPPFYHLKGSGSEYIFNFRASDDEILLTSETYMSKVTALRGIAAVREHALYDHYYHRKQSSSAQYYFLLKSTNHKVLGHSETYSTVEARDSAIQSLKTHGPNAPIIDNT